MAKRDFDARGDQPSFPGASGAARVALRSHPDPLCQQRDWLSLESGGLERSYELRGHEHVSLVDLLLGFTRGKAEVARATDYARPEPGPSFALPEGVSPAMVAAKVGQILRGEVSGFTGDVIALNGFHGAAHTVFHAVHQSVGGPRVALAPLVHEGAGQNLFEAARAVSPAIHAATLSTPDTGSTAPAQRFDRNQTAGATVVLQNDPAPVCPKCGGDMIDSPQGRICKALAEEETSLAGRPA